RPSFTVGAFLKASTFTSVGAKLFYYMSSLVLITVAVSSIQYAKTFTTFLTQQVQDSVLQQAETAGGQVENTIDTWRAQIAVALPTMRTVDQPKPAKEAANEKAEKAKERDAQEQALKNFVNSSPEFLMFE